VGLRGGNSSQLRVTPQHSFIKYILYTRTAKKWSIDFFFVPDIGYTLKLVQRAFM